MTPTDKILTTLIVLTIVAAIGTTIYVILVPAGGEKYTEFFILGEKGIAANYPAEMIVGRNYSVSIGIGNHEYRTVTYTIEIWSISMAIENMTNTSEVTSMDLLDRFPVTVVSNETAIMPYNLSIKKPEVNRIEFLLFNESNSGDSLIGMERINASYRDLHLWVTIHPEI